MPSLEVSKKDLEMLVGKKFKGGEELEQALEFAKCELDSMEGDALNIGVSDTNRPDLWSAEGVARELRARLGIEKGLPKYKVKKGKISCTIEKSVEKVRPFIACALIKNVKITDEFLRQMIQLQEKVGMTFGRKRKETGIGLYDFKKMSPPVFYRGYKDNAIEFVPLEFKVKMRPSEILAEHPKGKEFRHLLEGTERYPIVIDSENVVASMPPIINSETTGKVTEETKEIFIEVTGFDWEIVNTALNIMAMALADRGGKIESVKIKFPKSGIYPKKPIYTPIFDTRKMEVELNDIEKIIGLELSNKQILDLLAKARYNAKIKGKKLLAEYPSYRKDILHPVDVIEDIIIGLGYNKIKPLPVELPCIGSESAEAKGMDVMREICVGLGLQEVLTFTMTGREKQTGKLSLPKQEFVEIANPISLNYTVFRKKILPELLEFLAKNKHCLYPQKIFEVGRCLEIDEGRETKVREPVKLGMLLAGKGADFTTIKSALDAVCRQKDWKYSLQESELPFLEKGKQGEFSIGEKKGFLGALNKKTLAEFGLEMPAVCLELEI